MEGSLEFFKALPAVVAHRSHWGFEVGHRLLLDLIREVVNFKPVQPGDELVGRAFASVLWVNHDEHMGV